METLNWSQLTLREQSEALKRPVCETGSLEQTVAAIIAGVRRDQDDALRAYSLQFDQVEIDEFAVRQDEIEDAVARCDTGLLEDIDTAIGRIEAFHRASLPENVRVETAQGLVCEARYLPISPVGLYVPGGSAPLVSTVMMLAIPARLAGCERVVLCSPPSADGKIDPAILAAASRCGINEIFMAGGAQAIAAMAFGTQSIPKCAKLYGPGNAWVTEAKRQVASTSLGAAQDLPAGPSEVLVIADRSADPIACCWDLLSQAEHGPDSQAILISNNRELLQEVHSQIMPMAAKLPRAKILSSSLRSMRLVRVEQIEQAIDISNDYAPEHLILNCVQASRLADLVTSAGSVFVGAWTPESLGDYCSGTNHVLPTYGYARAYGGLSVSDFMRRMTLQTAQAEGLQNAGPVAARLAAAEGLDAHRMAVEYRLNSMDTS
jgi:histidinol dehydrogenase